MAHFPVAGGDKGPRSPSVHLCSTSWNLKNGPCTEIPAPRVASFLFIWGLCCSEFYIFKGPGSKRYIHSTGFLRSD